ncbi:TetR family transcriptional regulator C-terminal domain-containing protein [Curvibacter sp. CHRR-16]|uniref:TetR/AcrR family transcriptional regulator n=1 Tax=Curvibacter sp. CHRR-16 TaxID=2835872 RepID=UPI001BD931F0|nr:TetR/AcrR family transcriptional regulator [Curvibacter sp. CHRR-16]MBT0570220.1 TetR family transcriptional regulator C-terminal domain-containing protein [Curvibacter sp. CHRR-16]
MEHPLDISPPESTPDSASPAGNKGQIRQANEALILLAAEHVFARAGFGGATMAAIAEASGLPKANLHYYFGSKQALYRAVLERILSDWLMPAHGITRDADPRTALERYIRAKMALSAERPDASKVWANEILHGAQVVQELLATELRLLVLEKAAVVQYWVEQGRMAPVDGMQLFFTIWAATQTYADFDVQICAVMGQSTLRASDFERATDHVVGLVLRGCGL